MRALQVVLLYTAVKLQVRDVIPATAEKHGQQISIEISGNPVLPIVMVYLV